MLKLLPALIAAVSIAHASPPDAASVADRETLQAFIESEGFTSWDEAYEGLDHAKRDGQWRSGSTYFWIYSLDGICLFSPDNEIYEGQNLIELTDIDGVPIVAELLEIVAQGGGYLEYRWDNPEVEGDEEDGSNYVAYALSVNIGGTEFMLGSGFYVDDQKTAVRAYSWDQIKADLSTTEQPERKHNAYSIAWNT